MHSIALEICVDSIESAKAAEAGGADRIELCTALEVGGLTPHESLLRSVRAAVDFDIFTMIRPRAGNFAYTPSEIDQMLAEIERAGALGADGIVLGVLTHAGEVAVQTVKELVAAARPMQVTFHRAFDVSANLERSLEQVIDTGADRILTSAGVAHAIQASDRIAHLVRSASGRVSILAGGGIRQSNVRELVLATGVREVHTSLGFGDGDGGVIQKPSADAPVSQKSPARFVVREADVRAMRDLLEEFEIAGVPRRPAR